MNKPTYDVPLGYEPVTDDLRIGHRQKAIGKAVGIVFTAVGLAIAIIYFLGIRRAYSTATAENCASNLKSIGLACEVYANSHNGRFPDTFEEMLQTAELPAACLVCPATDDVAPPGNAAAEQISHLHDGKHLSYIYVGKGLTTSAPMPSTVVLAYEPLSNHHGDGSNFLFADGHVQFISLNAAKVLIAAFPAPPIGPSQ